MSESEIAPGRGLTAIVVGPVHAGIIEPGRFTFSSGGETVVRLDAQFGFSRRGVEESLRGRDALAAAHAVARICGGCSAARSWAYARALETLANAQCDESSELARVIFAEMERTYNHAFDLASACAGAGYGKGQNAGLALKERIVRLCAVHGGHRLLFDAIVPGGVRLGTLQQPEALRREIPALRAEIEKFLSDIFSNTSLVRRFSTTGKVVAEVAAALGAVGPAHRASHGALDERVARPYGAYQNLVPIVAHATQGDVEARCRVKGDELRNSCELIETALAALGTGVPGAPVPVRVEGGSAASCVEGPRGAETIAVECDAGGALTNVRVVSASARNWPVVVKAMDGNIVPDFPLVNKSFNLCYACADL